MKGSRLAVQASSSAARVCPIPPWGTMGLHGGRTSVSAGSYPRTGLAGHDRDGTEAVPPSDTRVGNRLRVGSQDGASGAGCDLRNACPRAIFRLPVRLAALTPDRRRLA